MYRTTLYDLDELGKYYIAYRALADHWQEMLADSIHVVRYETLVQDTENEIRRLLDYCGLDWEDSCLKFHENKSASTTASAVQVRQPMYTSSIGKWRRYEKQLEPLTENLRKHGPQLSNAASLLLPDVKLDVIAYSCTSGTIAMGYEEVERQIIKGRKNVPVVTPITAAIAAFNRLAIKSISLLTPHNDAVNEPLRNFIKANGVEVKYLNSFYVENDVDIARIPDTAIVRGALESYRDDTDALFVSCTALRAAKQVGNLEAKLGVPVLTSNQCMFWHALRTSGYDKSVTGYGRLLSS